MKRTKKTIVLLMAILLSATLAACNRAPSSSSSPASQDASSLESSQPLSSAGSSDSSQGELSLQEQKDRLAAELLVTHPDSQQYGPMQNGYGGLETSLYETGHVRMEYPIVSDGWYSQDRDPTGEIIPEFMGIIAFGSGIKQNLKEYPALFLSRFDLESEGTYLDMTYKIVRFDQKALTVKYFGTYRDAGGETEPVLFFANLDTDQYGRPLTIDGSLLSIQELPYVFCDAQYSGCYEVYPSSYVSRDEAQQYVNRWTKGTPESLEEVITAFFDTGIPDQNEGIDNHPLSNLYTWTTDETIELIVTNLPKEAGYWMRISLSLDQLIKQGGLIGSSDSESAKTNEYNISPQWMEDLMASW